jgi:hypothetical protein
MTVKLTVDYPCRATIVSALNVPYTKICQSILLLVKRANTNAGLIQAKLDDNFPLTSLPVVFDHSLIPRLVDTILSYHEQLDLIKSGKGEC